MGHWTKAWSGAEAVALSAWTRDPAALAAPRVLVAFEEALARACLAQRMAPLAVHVAEDAVHVVLAPSGADPTRAFGLAKAAATRSARGLRGRGGSLWRTRVRVLPLAGAELDRVLRRLASLEERRCRVPLTGVRGG